MAGNEYSPMPFDAVSRVTPLASFTIVTVTPGIGLCVSFTVPRKPPWADCADSAVGALTTSAIAINAHINEPRNVFILCSSNGRPTKGKRPRTPVQSKRRAWNGSVSDSASPAKWQVVADESESLTDPERWIESDIAVATGLPPSLKLRRTT